MSKPILSDHKRTGKKLTPPLLTLATYMDLSWVDYIIPDVIWIALIKNKFGNEIGQEIVFKFIEATNKRIKIEGFKVHAFISSYENLDQTTQDLILDDLQKIQLLPILQEGLKDFLLMYPKCPLGFLLYGINPDDDYSKDFVDGYKDLLWELIDKKSTESTFVIADVIFSLFMLDTLKVVENSSLLELPKIIDYPRTDISKKIASTLRATINVLYAPESFSKDSKWANEFWNRGIELEKCLI